MSYTHIQLGEVADHDVVRVTLRDGKRETVRDPRVEADSIKGENVRAIPLDQVAEFEAIGTDGTGTFFIMLGVTLLVVGIVAALTFDMDFNLGDSKSVE
jgi:hypothetical protein